MNTLAIIQARMGSSRLPGKVLMDLGGATVLARVVRRLERSQQITKVVVATTSARRRSDRQRVRAPASFVFSRFGGGRAGSLLPVPRIVSRRRGRAHHLGLSFD